MHLTLLRDTPGIAGTTYGVLAGAGVTLQTIEKPWVPSISGAPGGEPGLSCVPPGEYELVRHSSAVHPKTWALVNELLGVYHALPAGRQGRAEVLVHSGNTESDSEGCILLGLERTPLINGEPGVLESRRAFAILCADMPWVDGHTMMIIGQGVAA